MAIFRLFKFNNILNNGNFLCKRNNLKPCDEQRALISIKTLEKLGLPVPPKRPLTPYLRFVQSVRPTLVNSHPNTSPAVLMKLVAQEWQSYSPEKKKELQKVYLVEMESYLSILEKYKESITPEQQTLIENTKKKQKQAKQHSRILDKKEQLGKPKKPPTSFVLFMLEKKETKDTNIKFPDWLKLISKDWDSMSDQDKEKYRQKSKIDLEKYFIDLREWEEKMIRQGHTDVVRKKDLYIKLKKDP